MKTPEILAPAGSFASVLAALRCGADAIYVGGKQFSARQNAENFDLDQLKEAVQLCHLYGAKLYLTVNTLIFDNEFPALEVYLRDAVRCGIDAFLVQDLGVLSLIQEIVPKTPVHASTQMTIHTPAGAEWAKAHGFSRIVAARELSRTEILALCQCGIEVEQFVHGALCMSVSGQCGLSAMIGSRSANRGRCAQACRLPFTAKDEDGGCALSLKDLCLVPYVTQMARDGVASLKIEGRCKRPEYVAAAVTALVQARDGIEPDLDTLRAVFSRSGFTDGYYTGTRQNMFGVRQKEDVVSAKDVLPKLEQLYQKPIGHIPLTMHITLQAGKPVTLQASDDNGNSVTVTGEIPQSARSKATDLVQLERQFSKLGGTIYTLGALTADCDAISMLPASALNALRRDCTAAMDKRRIQMNTPEMVLLETQPISVPSATTKRAKFRIQTAAWKTEYADLLEEASVEALLLPAHTVSDCIPASCCRSKIFLTMPRFCADEAKAFQWLTYAAQLGFSHIVCENVAHILLGKKLGMQLHGGMGLNSTNSRSLTLLQQEGLTDTLLSPELTVAQIDQCAGLPFGLYVYGNQPVMTMRNCPIRAEVGCQGCQHQLTDRTDRSFPVYCDQKAGMTTMYNVVPTWMAEKLGQLIHASFWLLDCTLSPNAQAILKAYQNNCTTDEPMTRGLFYRGVE